MSFPLYEYDQIITLEELIAVARMFSKSYSLLPRWRIFSRLKLRIQFDLMVSLIDGLRAKPSLVNELRSQNQGESR